MLGHSSIEITADLYIDQIPELQADAARKINEGFANFKPSDKPVEKASKSKLPSKLPSSTDKEHTKKPRGRLPGGRKAL
jgi:hypothetical protein